VNRPAYTILGPCPCMDCGKPVYWARSLTRNDDHVTPGWLTWREVGGRVHRCPKGRATRLKPPTQYTIDERMRAKLRGVA
jgi:hypothetical protein